MVEIYFQVDFWVPSIISEYLTIVNSCQQVDNFTSQTGTSWMAFYCIYMLKISMEFSVTKVCIAVNAQVEICNLLMEHRSRFIKDVQFHILQKRIIVALVIPGNPYPAIEHPTKKNSF